VAARVALHRGDGQTARQHLVRTQRARSLLTYALPHMAVQARIELIRVHLALGDLSGARTLMQEVNELLRCRPGLGSLIGEARALRDRLASEGGSRAPGACSPAARRSLRVAVPPPLLVVRGGPRGDFPPPAPHRCESHVDLPEAR